MDDQSSVSHYSNSNTEDEAAAENDDAPDEEDDEEKICDKCLMEGEGDEAAHQQLKLSRRQLKVAEDLLRAIHQVLLGDVSLIFLYRRVIFTWYSSLTMTLRSKKPGIQCAHWSSMYFGSKRSKNISFFDIGAFSISGHLLL